MKDYDSWKEGYYDTEDNKYMLVSEHEEIVETLKLRVAEELTNIMKATVSGNTQAILDAGEEIMALLEA